MVGDAGEYVGKVMLRVEAVELGTLNQCSIKRRLSRHYRYFMEFSIARSRRSYLHLA